MTLQDTPLSSVISKANEDHPVGAPDMDGERKDGKQKHIPYVD
jgi:hypothetical protein